MTLTDARTEAFERIERRKQARLSEGAQIAPGVFAPIDLDSQVAWLGADRFADEIMAANPGGYTSEFVDASGAPVLYTLTSAAQIRTSALACLARWQQVHGAALAARAAVRQAVTADAVNAALAAYLAAA